MIDVCLLGCGGMMPLFNRKLTALLVRHKGSMILIDCGEGTQVGIRQAGWGFKQIEAIFLTHYHADHVSGLPGFLLTLGNSGRTEPLTIYGPPMLKQVVSALSVISPELPYELILCELSAKDTCVFKVGELIIKSLPLDHWMPCLAYSMEINRPGKFNLNKAKELNIPMEFWKRLQSGETITNSDTIYTPEMIIGEARKGLKLCYCTDSRPIEELADFCDCSDLLVCEGMYGSDEHQQKAIDKKHMIFSEAAMIAKQSNSKLLWLTHFSPALEEPESFIDFARLKFSNTIVGQDLLKTTLVFD